MNTAKHIEEKVDGFVAEERTTAPNPFMATRIMAAIENYNNPPAVQSAPVWRIAIVAVVLALAVVAGVAAGNLYETGTADNNTVMINDDAMEHFGFYTAAADE